MRKQLELEAETVASNCHVTALFAPSAATGLSE